LGNSAKALAVVALSLPLVMMTAVGFDLIDFTSVWADLAKVFFFVVPVLFVVSTALGLAARRRA